MPNVNWTVFEGLPGAATDNFEYLCRALIRRHYGQFGSLQGLSNQPGIEFHLNLNTTCSLGGPDRWYGWQCKWYDLPSGRAIGTTRRNKIEKAIEDTEKLLPGVTDWVLWTRHILTKGDQEWFYSLETKMKLHLWTKDEVAEHLSGPAEILRGTYFGELILTPDVLTDIHKTSIAPIRQRWIPEVHQVMYAEEQIGFSLGSASAWNELVDIHIQIEESTQEVIDLSSIIPESIAGEFTSACETANEYSLLLSSIHQALEAGDYDLTLQLIKDGTSFDPDWNKALRKLRNTRNRAAIYFTNLLSLIVDAQASLQSLSEVLQKRVLAVVANAGCGKTQLAAQLTSPTEDRIAGVLLHGRDLGARQRLDDLSKTVVIQGKPVETFEALIAALDAAGERAGRRLPIVIDGLNEAEDPRVWKSYLESIGITLSKYPYTLLVCTLRSEFIDEALPEDVQQLELPGFEENLWESIAAYFKYYMIKPGDAELPVHLLTHPLTMRLFCEVTNPMRQDIVGVEAMPDSLVALFEKYLTQVADRVAQLAHSACRYYASDIRSALNQIGLSLWADNTRSIEIGRLRQSIGDQQRNWDQSLVRALESEGILYRVPGRNAGTTEISISYDALAGHIVADSLLSQYGGDSFKKWLDNPSTASLLFGDIGKRHTLSGDILKALVGLVPIRMYRKQLWSFLDAGPKEDALYEAAWLSNEHLDSKTVELLADLVKKEPSMYRRDLLNRLATTRAAFPHPLDAYFLDNVLRSMNMVDRDTRWTEWVRKSSQEQKKDILHIEMKWKKSPVRGKEDSLRAIWIMWVLTSTVRTLRDHATRALYWYGMGSPGELFKQTLESFSINDYYVIERMLAASYGVSMALWADDKSTELRSELPNLARSLVEEMFIPGAPAPSSHILIREFALGIIELALKVDPKSIDSDKIMFLQPPFEQLPLIFPDPDQIDQSVSKMADSAIHMDFGNYTLGHLIPKRSNYDYKHPIYKEVRLQIEHRIVELGYSEEIFGSIDKQIQELNWRQRSDEQGKTDRYGKKYSWISYFEMYGLRSDKGELPEWRQDERIPDVDIDPSFPEYPSKWHPILPEIFKQPFREVPMWIADGPTPDYTHLLQPELVDDEQGPWVLLEGFINQKASEDPRNVFTFLRGIMTGEKHCEAILEEFNTIDYPGNSAIPEPIENHYCFAGEIPWSKQYAQHIRNSDGTAKPHASEAFSNYPEKGIPIEIPVCEYSWESYHSELNQAGNVTVLAPYLCEQLGIAGKWGKWDFFDDQGNLATIVRTFKEEDSPHRSKLFYIRKDLLIKYLTSTNQKLVWLLWGEREFDYRYSRNLTKGHTELFQNHQHIHRYSSTLELEHTET